jgi:hypothetical protein
MNTETQQRNCAFQYAKITRRIFSHTELVCDKTELTLSEAQDLWNQYFPDCAKHIKDPDNHAEMVIWIDMDTPHSYGKYLCHIASDAESDGKDIWETKKTYFTREFKIEQNA